MTDERFPVAIIGSGNPSSPASSSCPAHTPPRHSSWRAITRQPLSADSAPSPWVST